MEYFTNVHIIKTSQYLLHKNKINSKLFIIFQKLKLNILINGIQTNKIYRATVDL